MNDSAETPTVRPGQVWQGRSGWRYRIDSPEGEGWEMTVVMDDGRNGGSAWISSSDIASGLYTLVQDAPEETREHRWGPAEGGYSRRHCTACGVGNYFSAREGITPCPGEKPVAPDKYTIDAGGIRWTNPAGAGTITITNTGPAPTPPSPADHDRVIAAKMEAVNAAFHERHKEQIKQALGFATSWPERRYSEAAPEIQLRGRR